MHTLLIRNGFILSICLLPFFAQGQYCLPAYTVGTTDNDYIDGFQMNTINNLGNGPGDGSGYSDFTAMSDEIMIGSTNEIHIVNTPYFLEGYRAWIDYNQDGNFGSTEELFTPFTLPADAEDYVEFTVPATAFPGPTVLRIRCVYNTTAFDACSSQTYGEAEDYAITILGYANDLKGLMVNPIADACDLGADVPVTFTVKNIGTDPASGFTVSYDVDGGAVTSATYPGILAAGDSVAVTFGPGADLSADGTHVIRCWTDLTGDEFTGNDTAWCIVNNLFTDLNTGFPASICYTGEHVFPSPIAGGGTWSGDGIIDPVTGEFDPLIIGGIGGSTDITYSFTPASPYTVSPIPFAPYTLVDPTVAALGDDAFIDNINLGFYFTYLGNVYNKIFICSNGYIGFGAGTNSYAVQHFPNVAYPNDIIAFCFTDLNPAAGGSIKYEMQGTAPNRRFIVEYLDVVHYGHTQTVSGQIVLYETTNAIDLHVTDIQNDGGNMTQGIENIDGTIAYVTDELYNNQPFAMTEKGWRFAVTPCAGSVTETISIVEPPVVVIDDADVCLGTAVTLDAGAGAAEYAWSTGETTQTIEVTATGTYWVVYYANPTCFVADSATINIHPLPTIDLGDDGVVCEGVMLDAGNPGDEYLWNTGATTQTIFVDASGTYSVTVTDSFTGCVNADTVDFTLTPLPVAAFTATPIGPFSIICNNTSIDALTYMWDFGDGTISYEENPWHTYPSAGTWTVQLIVTNSCGADIQAETIAVTSAVQDMQNANGIKVFPNPASTVISIDAGALFSGICYAGIYDLQGRNVLQTTTASGTTCIFPIDISKLISGDYMVVITNGAQYYSIPLVVAK